MVLYVGLLYSKNDCSWNENIKLISGNTGKYEIWNEEISLKIGVSLIEEKKNEGKSLEIVWSYLEKSDLSWGNKKAGQIRVNQRRNKENDVG